ncbi:MAG TPA: type II methionyl aminopeptidase [Candidatus Baltobacteraceae bacterium]|nr:type II methionyl aminopeptidase [Candidatus Baltobacteraceae bacterium]
MEENEIKIMKEVGAASKEAMLKAKGMIKPGVRIMDVAEATEKFLREKGYGLAFPINLSINEQAAHFTPSVGDDSVFPEDALVKIDFGAEKNGFLGDGAITLDLSGRHSKMVEAATMALDNAISMAKAGAEVGKIGGVIEETITKMGFKPIKNLGGHGVEEHDLHAGIFVPNFDNHDDTVLEEGEVIAIEPFVTNGRGMVVNSDACEIYSYAGATAIRSTDGRKIMEYLDANHPTEPFAVRWLSEIIDSKFRLYAAIGELLRAGVIEPHNGLIESANGMVAQAEAELLVQKGGCEIITK